MDREYIDKPFMDLDPTHHMNTPLGWMRSSPQEKAKWMESKEFFGPHHVTIVNSKQVGGTHYASKGIQPWDYVIANNMGYLEGCIIKYVTRYKDKNGLEDLKKAKHYLEKLMEGIGGE